MMNASEGILKDTALRYSGELQSSSMMAAAANERIQGREALYGGLFQGAGTLLTSGLRTFTPTSVGGLGLKFPGSS